MAAERARFPFMCARRCGADCEVVAALRPAGVLAGPKRVPNSASDCVVANVGVQAKRIPSMVALKSIRSATACQCILHCRPTGAAGGLVRAFTHRHIFDRLSNLEGKAKVRRCGINK